MGGGRSFQGSKRSSTLLFSCLDNLWCLFPNYRTLPYLKRKTFQNGEESSKFEKHKKLIVLMGIVGKVIAGLHAHSSLMLCLMAEIS